MYLALDILTKPFFARDTKDSWLFKIRGLKDWHFQWRREAERGIANSRIEISFVVSLMSEGRK